VHCRSPAAVRAMENPHMRNVVIVIGIVLCCCSSSHAQDVPRVEIFGGYSYLNIDTNGLTSRQSANGWEASVAGNFNTWLALEGDASGYYKTYPEDLSILGLGLVDVNVHDYGFVGGPRINFRPFFVHALIGVDRVTGSALGSSASQNSFAGAFGGGIQWPVAQHWAVRGSADYVLTQHNIFGGPEYTQNNFRVSAGIVYTFGGTPEARSRRTDHQKAALPQCEGSSEVALLGVMGCGDDTGVKVTSVLPGSPAALAGISAGDTITDIDGRPVRSSRDIEAAIAANTSGTVKISYMIRGSWLTERQAKIR
jgi:opacity protein-like surface antigen